LFDTFSLFSAKFTGKEKGHQGGKVGKEEDEDKEACQKAKGKSWHYQEVISLNQ
jgi:hypothetical protein